MGGSAVVSPFARKRSSIHCCSSNSVIGFPSATLIAACSNAPWRMRSTIRPAARCDSSCSADQLASNFCTRSAELTTFFFSLRISSIVPASTSPMYGMLFSGEYCMAIRLLPARTFGSSLVQFFPARVFELAAFERIEHPGFDAVHQFARLAARRNEVEPAPRGHSVFAQAQHVAGDGIAPVVVEKKPSVDLAGFQLGLNRWDINRRHSMDTILAEVAARFSRLPQQCGYLRSVTPATATRFVRLSAPLTILTADTGTFKASAVSSDSAP